MKDQAGAIYEPNATTDSAFSADRYSMSAYGYTIIILAADYLARYFEAKALKSGTAMKIGKFSLKQALPLCSACGVRIEEMWTNWNVNKM